MSKDIVQYNEKGQLHGYWEVYNPDGTLWFKRNINKGNLIGYEEYHVSTNKIFKTFYIT